MQMLKSKYVDDFFGITDRIKTITAQLEEMNKKMPLPKAQEEEQLFTGVVPLAPGVEEEMGRGDAKGEARAKKADTKPEVVRTLELDDVSGDCIPLYVLYSFWCEQFHVAADDGSN
jgi:hypothetical protein